MKKFKRMLSTAMAFAVMVSMIAPTTVAKADSVVISETESFENWSVKSAPPEGKSVLEIVDNSIENTGDKGYDYEITKELKLKKGKYYEIHIKAESECAADEDSASVWIKPYFNGGSDEGYSTKIGFSEKDGDLDADIYTVFKATSATQKVGFGLWLPANTNLDVTEVCVTELSKAPSVSKVSFSSKKGAKKSISLKWKKKSCTGYQIRYSTKSNMKSAKTVVLDYETTTKCTLKKLKAKKKYYVQIRAFKYINSTQEIYGKWSKAVSVKTK